MPSLINAIFRCSLAGIAAFALPAISGHAQQSIPSASIQSRPPVNVDNARLALRGYDPVAYFRLGKPTQGRAEFSAEHEGHVFWFVSDEHRAAFLSSPASYRPQYGGFCAYAVANGYTADADPSAWKIVDGKLYLNYNTAVAKSWEKGQSGYIKSGDRNWTNWPKLKRS